ncbi:Fungal specific transcription factor domain-containing protein 69 [Elsinoe fawcettii]|nr:Fungal specific transcription factor domain-containing protein 69 [Elsinoe fawcettii]
MSEKIKTKIKHNAHVRRETRKMPGKDQGTIMDLGTHHEDSGMMLDSPMEEMRSESVIDEQNTRATLPTPLSHLAPSLSASTTTSHDQVPISEHGALGPQSFVASGWAVPIPMQLSSAMIYLDYVFPFLFPFYQPSLIETGRQWLLGLLCQNDVTFHVATSLSAYFFTLVPQSDDQDMHDDCKALVLENLEQQMDMAFTSIQDTLSVTSNRRGQRLLLDMVRVIEEIIQLLIVEVTVRRSSHWTVHLTPALSILDEVLRDHGIEGERLTLKILLDALPSNIPAGTAHHKSLPNTADQSALIFFVSLLAFLDIIASTSLAKSPSLQRYHDDLLTSGSGSIPSVQLESITGCQNWVLLVIGNIATLCEWKARAKQSGTFSVFDLVRHAEPISQALQKGMEALEAIDQRPVPAPARFRDIYAYYSRHDKSIDGAFISKITRLWACAASIYLSVSLSGWQTQHVDVQSSVHKILDIAPTIESPAQLRSLAWPICVAGCLALPGQESDFRRLVGRMGSLCEFGTMSNALRIMEAVWSKRDSIDPDSWNLSSSLRILGSPALLF